MTLTKQQQRDHIDDGGVHCPYCNSEELDSDYTTVDAGRLRLFQQVYCEKCGRDWTDVYALAEIMEAK